jgi:hypothetical protein
MAVIGRFLAGAASRLWALVGPTLVTVLIDKIRWAVIAWKRRSEITAAVKAEREATEAAKTKEERDRAAEGNRL